jgi:hypothetical protein
MWTYFKKLHDVITKNDNLTEETQFLLRDKQI